MSKIVVIGQGYVGLPLAMEAVSAGHIVVGVDTDIRKVEDLNRGLSPIEDVTKAMLDTALASGRYWATSRELGGFDVAVITVPTPLKDGAPDLSYVRQAAERLVCNIDAERKPLIVLESTTYPGTTEEVLIPILESLGKVAGEDFHVAYSPERIDPGNQTWSFRNTPKLVAGYTGVCLGAARDFYSKIVDTVVPVANLRSAEMAKIIENTFRHVNIALVNELGRLAYGLGVDMRQALLAAETKPYGFMRFDTGPGVGGHCLPIDPLYLAHRVKQELGVPSRFIDLAQDVNDHQPDYVVQRLAAGLNKRFKPVNGSKILVLGLAYKPNTADMRETPAARIVDLLNEQGAELSIVDTYVRTTDYKGVPVYPGMPQAPEYYDAIVLVTDHDGVDYGSIQDSAQYVLDTRSVFGGDTKNVEAL